jgi:hypothetical protein
MDSCRLDGRRWRRRCTDGVRRRLSVSERPQDVRPFSTRTDRSANANHSRVSNLGSHAQADAVRQITIHERQAAHPRPQPGPGGSHRPVRNAYALSYPHLHFRRADQPSFDTADSPPRSQRKYGSPPPSKSPPPIEVGMFNHVWEVAGRKWDEAKSRSGTAGMGRGECLWIRSVMGV